MLFAVYIDDLLSILKKSRIGCHINSVFVGAFVFADDIMLLLVDRFGLQVLVDIYHNFANERNLKFGTNNDPSKSKTKCSFLSSGSELLWIQMSVCLCICLSVCRKK